MTDTHPKLITPNPDPIVEGVRVICLELLKEWKQNRKNAAQPTPDEGWQPSMGGGGNSGDKAVMVSLLNITPPEGCDNIHFEAESVRAMPDPAIREKLLEIVRKSFCNGICACLGACHQRKVDAILDLLRPSVQQSGDVVAGATAIIESVWEVWYGQHRGRMNSDEFAGVLEGAKHAIIALACSGQPPESPDVAWRALENIIYALNNSRGDDEALHTIGNEASWALAQRREIRLKEDEQ